MVSAFTLVNKFSENQSLVKYRSDQVKKTKCADSWIPWERSVFMLHARTFQTVSLTENINIHACGGELAGLYTFTRDWIGFIYDKRAQVIYCSLSWHWYIFETSNLSDRIDFIMFPVANEKQRLSMALITRRFLWHPFIVWFCCCTLPLEVN